VTSFLPMKAGNLFNTMAFYNHFIGYKDRYMLFENSEIDEVNFEEFCAFTSGRTNGIVMSIFYLNPWAHSLLVSNAFP